MLVGLFMMIGLAALLFLALRAGNMLSLNFGQKTYQVTAVFDNVGRVKSISLDPETFQAVVTMDLDCRFKFPADTSAKILTAGLLGEKYVGLDAGSDDKVLENHGRIEQTQSSIVLENLVSQFLFNSAEKKGGDKKDAE